MARVVTAAKKLAALRERIVKRIREYDRQDQFYRFKTDSGMTLGKIRCAREEARAILSDLENL